MSRQRPTGRTTRRHYRCHTLPHTRRRVRHVTLAMFATLALVLDNFTSATAGCAALVSVVGHIVSALCAADSSASVTKYIALVRRDICIVEHVASTRAEYAASASVANYIASASEVYVTSAPFEEYVSQR